MQVGPRNDQKPLKLWTVEMDLAQCALCNPPIVQFDTFISLNRLNQSINQSEKSHHNHSLVEDGQILRFLTCCVCPPHGRIYLVG